MDQSSILPVRKMEYTYPMIGTLRRRLRKRFALSVHFQFHQFSLKFGKLSEFNDTSAFGGIVGKKMTVLITHRGWWRRLSAWSLTWKLKIRCPFITKAS
jgi:hypothetical protein